MSDFLADLGVMHDENLGLFGRDVIYTPTPTLGQPMTIRGILNEGVLIEEAFPGVNALLTIKDDAVSPLPAAGEEITVGSVIYKILDFREHDAGGMVRLRLRKDRLVV